MIKVKFSELKVGDEFHFLNGVSIFTKQNEKEYSHKYKDEICYYSTPNNNMEVYISKFKDRYGKDLSVGDRVLIALKGDEEGCLIDRTIDNIILSKGLYQSLTDRYDIVIEGKVYQWIHYSNIVKIEFNWGI